MATPESLDPSNPVYVVGIGPGDPAYLTPRGEARLAQADVVLGFESVIEYVRDLIDGDVLVCSYDDEQVQLEAFAEYTADGAQGTVAMMGDPNFSGYQFLGKLEQVVDRPVTVIPGISSLQLAASRARTPMEESTFVTLHKSGPIETDLDRLVQDVGDRHLLVLPRPFDWMPERIAAHLIDNGASETLDSIVFERLTHEEESATRSTLGELSKRGASADESRFSDVSILVVRTVPS